MAAIVLFPFPAFGHLNPTLKLARALQRAGHQICYLGLADFEEYVRSQGFDFIPILASPPAGAASGDAPARLQVNPLEIVGIGEGGQTSEINNALLKEIAAELKPIIRKRKPDLLIVDYLIGGFGYMASQELGITSALIDSTIVEGLMLGEPAPETVKRKLPVLVMCPDALDFPGPWRQPHRHYIEPSVDLQRQELQPFPWDMLDPSKPLIYCSFGSQAYVYKHSIKIFRAVIEAVGERPEWQLVLAVGPYLKTEAFAPLPDNVLVVNWAPQLKLLERAAVMITHGGMGAVKECIFFAVPMIVFPCRWDQPHNAARVVHHGLGLRGDISDGSVGQVRRLLEELSGSGQYKARVAAMSRTFREVEDSGIGVRTVEGFLQETHLRKPAGQTR
ncbi:MAG TPA: glycosyltransferase [Blastocatellia bacterium]|nr:glycosyltransferase [Blastocatellia bacterium]